MPRSSPNRRCHVSKLSTIVSRRRGILVGNREQTPEEWPDTEHAQQSTDGVHAHELLRLAVIRERTSNAAIAGDAHGFRLCLPLKKGAGRHRVHGVRRRVLRRFTRGHHPIRLAQPQRCEQHAVHETENRRVRADAECKGENRRQRKAWGATQRPNGKCQILRERIEHVLLQVSRRLMSANGSSRPTFANRESEQAGDLGAERENGREVAARRSRFSIELDEDGDHVVGKRVVEPGWEQQDQQRGVRREQLPRARACSWRRRLHDACGRN